jgi:hypothetical protein
MVKIHINDTEDQWVLDLDNGTYRLVKDPETTEEYRAGDTVVARSQGRDPVPTITRLVARKIEGGKSG